MMAARKKVVVAMSGGVDSSVAAGILVAEGYDVSGASLRLWDYEREGPENCSDYRGAREVADLLGIPHTVLDARGEFIDQVGRSFAADYLCGRTPNPCVACNRDFKLGILLGWALARGADYVATGHYARVRHDPGTGQAELLRGKDRSKDQSYFLFALSQRQLAHTLFPLGELTKDAVRGWARRFGLPVADRPESQDVCFGDYRDMVASQAGPDDIGPGEIVDRSGKVLGSHQGIYRLTVGQRRGLGVSASRPLYVTEIDAAARRVVVGEKEDLARKGLLATGVHWIGEVQEGEFAAEVQTRYRSRPVICSVRADACGGCEVRFDEPCFPVTPGQAAVFYRGEKVLGGGWIEGGF